MTAQRTSRRQLMHSAARSALGLVTAATPQIAGAASAEPTLVFVVLRGGADALSLVVPYADPDYYRVRTAIAAPGVDAACALDLDGRVGLHPRLAPLLPLYRAAELGVVMGTGMGDSNHRHGDAQRRIEALLASSVGAPLERAPRPVALGARLADVAASTLRSRDSASAFLVDSEGWDTHAAQGAATGRLALRCAELAQELAVFRARLDTVLSRVIVVVTSEFGRTITETAMAGTDDGGASVALVLGNTAYAGRVRGEMPDLSRGRHLAVTTELRHWLPGLCARAPGVSA